MLSKPCSKLGKISPPSPSMSLDTQPSAGEVTHWARVVPDRLVVSGFPSPISKRFMPAMSIPMSVITNKNLQLEEEIKMTDEAEGDTVNLKHQDKKAGQNKTKLSKLLAVRKVVEIPLCVLHIEFLGW